MPTTNSNDILEIDLPEDEAIVSQKLPTHSTAHKSAPLVFDRVQVVMSALVVLGVLLVAIGNVSISNNHQLVEPSMLYEVFASISFGVLFAQFILVADFFLRGSVNVWLRLLGTSVVILAITMCSAFLFPFDFVWQRLYFLFCVWSFSALVQLGFRWLLSAYLKIPPQNDSDLALHNSPWSTNSSQLARTFCVIFLFTVFLASVKITFDSLETNLFALTWIIVIVFGASLFWPFVITYRQIWKPLIVFSTALLICLLAVAYLDDYEFRKSKELLICTSGCILWLSFGATVLNIAKEKAANFGSAGTP